MCIPPNVTGQIWVDSNNNSARDLGELGWKEKPIRIDLFGTTPLRASMDSQGHFVFQMPYRLPNQTFTVYDEASGRPLAMFTTDENGTAYVPIPIPVPGPNAGTSVSFGGNETSMICADTPYHVVAGTLVDPGDIERKLQVDLTTGTNYVASSVKAPPGWILEFSTDGGVSWNGTEPSPASRISNIRAISPEPVEAFDWVNGTGNTEQVFRASSTIALSAGQLTSATGGFGCFLGHPLAHT